MKIFWSIAILFSPIPIVAQIIYESQEIISTSEKGQIISHISPSNGFFGAETVLSAISKNTNTGISSFLNSPSGSAFQGSAQNFGHGVTGFAQGGYGLRGESRTNYGAYILSIDYHAAYFRGDKTNGFADIVLGATTVEDNGVISSDPGASGSDLFAVANDAVVAKIDRNKNGQGNFFVFDGDNDQLFQVDINGNVSVNGTTVHGSDRNRKESVIEVSNNDILNAIIEMPIYEWQYKKEERRHIGPMAQDFHKAFGLGDDDKSIAAIDADGVALAAIKAQQILIEEQALQIKLLTQEIKSIKAQLK